MVSELSICMAYRRVVRGTCRNQIWIWRICGPLHRVLFQQEIFHQVCQLGKIHSAQGEVFDSSLDDANEYMNITYLNYGKRYEDISWSSQLCTQLKISSCEIKAWKKFRPEVFWILISQLLKLCTQLVIRVWETTRLHYQLQDHVTMHHTWRATYHSSDDQYCLGSLDKLFHTS